MKRDVHFDSDAESVTVETGNASLTITARDQSCEYNGEITGVKIGRRDHHEHSELLEHLRVSR